MFDWLRRPGRSDGPTKPKSCCGDEEPWGWDEYMEWKSFMLRELGYQVEWRMAGAAWFRVVSPHRDIPYRPLVWAEAKVYPEPSEYGIEHGRISKLTIATLYRPCGDCCGVEERLFHFDRGLAMNRLTENRRAKILYADTLRELN